MVADYDKFNVAVGNFKDRMRLSRYFSRRECIYLPAVLIARLANCPKGVVEVREERTDPLYYRLFKSFLRGSFEGSINAHKLNLVDSESILKLTKKVVLHAADKGNCVIVGRGSQFFLEDRDDTLRVFLYASRREKVHRVMARGKSEAEAEELVDTVVTRILDQLGLPAPGAFRWAEGAE